MALLPTSPNMVDQNPKAFASLTLQGFIRDIGKQLDQALAYCFVSQASQSYIWSGRVTSVQRIIHDTSGNIDITCSSLQINLENYLKGIFGEATVTVTSNSNTATGNAVALYVYASVTINGKQYNTAGGVTGLDSRTLRFFDLNNAGPSY